MINEVDCLYSFKNKREPAKELHFEVCGCCKRATLRDEIGYTDPDAIKDKAQALSIILSRLNKEQITQEIYDRVKEEIETSDFQS